jgi:hypothetical protein
MITPQEGYIAFVRVWNGPQAVDEVAPIVQAFKASVKPVDQVAQSSHDQQIHP